MGSLVDDVIATVDVKRFAGNEPRRIMCKEGRGHTHIVDAHQTACRSLCFGLVE